VAPAGEVYQLVGLIGFPALVSLVLLYIVHKDLRDVVKMLTRLVERERRGRDE
jgi:hypothetical protein